MLDMGFREFTFSDSRVREGITPVEPTFTCEIVESLPPPQGTFGLFLHRCELSSGSPGQQPGAAGGGSGGGGGAGGGGGVGFGICWRAKRERSHNYRERLFYVPFLERSLTPATSSNWASDQPCASEFQSPRIPYAGSLVSENTSSRQ